MLKRTLFAGLLAFLVASSASFADAATTWKRLGTNPFYQPPLTSPADLGTLVKNRAADLKAGFAKAGQPDLYPAFVEQFPKVTIETVKIAPGETFTWMLFRKRKTGRLFVSRDVTWAGAAAFDGFRFDIDKDGQRYTFVVPFACGNFTLKSVAPVPPPQAAAPVAPPPPAPAAPVPPPVVAETVVEPPKPTPPAPQPPPPPPAPVAPPKPTPPAPQPPPPAPVPVPPPPAPPVAKDQGGPLVDVGLSRQPDPANYAFARVGYELPIADKLYLVGLVGGYARWQGNDGGSAFTADAMLDWHWLNKWSVGAGLGYWSGNDGQVDLLANAGCLLGSSGNTELFVEARLPVDELDHPNDFGRFGLGLRYRFATASAKAK